ncbi:hypothetical protein BOO86_15145 [Mycobacterium sp. CBMA 234]|uniref:hypothetical protein n=1 Tax=Mycolicibacterium sp. CBMA 234 TaxID=1918495 RepID=UPI0012DF479B|nr:hypothetical protein [Mycolicibacterium sp. CBMA 234]MUL65809.1 hypothetical protein [Mycolicibacterium sp. CBMA 234]
MSEPNDLLPYFVILALSTIAHCLWMRRFAWSNYYDRPATLSVAMEGAAILVMTPVIGTHIGTALHRLTGLWHIQYLLAHWLLFAGGACAIANFLTRLGDDHTVRVCFRLHIELPLALTLPLMLAAFTLSSVNRYPIDFLLSPMDTWLMGYWLIACAMGFRLITCALQCLFILRREQRHRTVADIYILGCIAGLVVVATQLSTVFITKPWGAAAPLVAGCITVTIFACSATYSWYRRPKPQL